MIDVNIYYRYSERVYFSLLNDVYLILIDQDLRELLFFIDFCHFYFLNSDISVTIYVTEMNFSVCAHKVPLEGSMSQIFNIGPSYYFM